MTLILGIETSTKICSVAISDGKKLLAIKEEGGEYSHAEKLMAFIQEVLKEANVELNDLDVIAISKGPGSYTGLRIGVSTAKGLCYSLDIPLVSVSTLRAMAKQKPLDLDGVCYCPMIDARRMEVFTSLFDDKNEELNSISAKIIDADSFAEELKENKIVFFGDGADKCQEVLSSHPNAVFSEEGLPSAEFVNEIGLEKYIQEDFEDVAYFEPYYLKDFIATTPKKLL